MEITRKKKKSNFCLLSFFFSFLLLLLLLSSSPQKNIIIFFSHTTKYMLLHPIPMFMYVLVFTFNKKSNKVTNNNILYQHSIG